MATYLNCLMQLVQNNESMTLCWYNVNLRVLRNVYKTKRNVPSYRKFKLIENVFFCSKTCFCVILSCACLLCDTTVKWAFYF